MADKADVVFGLLGQHVAPGGVVYGATILGDEAGHNFLGRRLMKIYNRKGIFGNQADSLTELKLALAGHFSDYEVRLQGKVALFSARKPILAE